jgi:hypothetical protein
MFVNCTANFKESSIIGYVLVLWGALVGGSDFLIKKSMHLIFFYTFFHDAKLQLSIPVCNSFHCFQAVITAFIFHIISADGSLILQFHKIWGQLMKTGYQNSRFSHQVLPSALLVNFPWSVHLIATRVHQFTAAIFFCCVQKFLCNLIDIGMCFSIATVLIQVTGGMLRQVERFACLYTSHVTNLCYYSPDKSYRTSEDYMPHELEGMGF